MKTKIFADVKTFGLDYIATLLCSLFNSGASILTLTGLLHFGMLEGKSDKRMDC